MFKTLFAAVLSLLTYFVTRQYDQKKINQLERHHALELDTTFLKTYDAAYATGFEEGVRAEKTAASIRRYHARQR